MSGGGGLKDAVMGWLISEVGTLTAPEIKNLENVVVELIYGGLSSNSKETWGEAVLEKLTDDDGHAVPEYPVDLRRKVLPVVLFHEPSLGDNL